jgi:hypothetical protein
VIGFTLFLPVFKSSRPDLGLFFGTKMFKKIDGTNKKCNSGLTSLET